MGIAVQNAQPLAKSKANRVSEWTNAEDAVGREIVKLAREGRFGPKVLESKSLLEIFDD